MIFNEVHYDLERTDPADVPPLSPRSTEDEPGKPIVFDYVMTICHKDGPAEAVQSLKVSKLLTRLQKRRAEEQLRGRKLSV
jgi:hypothetical protein